MTIKGTEFMHTASIKFLAFALHTFLEDNAISTFMIWLTHCFVNLHTLLAPFTRSHWTLHNHLTTIRLSFYPLFTLGFRLYNIIVTKPCNWLKIKRNINMSKEKEVSFASHICSLVNQALSLGWHLSIGDYKHPHGKGLEHFHYMACSTDSYTDFVNYWLTLSDLKASLLNLIGANDANRFGHVVLNI